MIATYRQSCYSGEIITAKSKGCRGRIEDTQTLPHHDQLRHVAAAESKMSSRPNRRLSDLASLWSKWEKSLKLRFFDLEFTWPNQRCSCSWIKNSSTWLRYGRMREIATAPKTLNLASSWPNVRGCHGWTGDVVSADSKTLRLGLVMAKCRGQIKDFSATFRLSFIMAKCHGRIKDFTILLLHSWIKKAAVAKLKT